MVKLLRKRIFVKCIRWYRVLQRQKKKECDEAFRFVGQLPLKENHTVDLPQTERILHLSIPYEELDDCMEKLLEGLTTQTLLLKKEDGSYEVNKI